ncbi:MAG: hypothetical protein CV087_19515 [Candidatus Brocadia sp. WS118]|nr:MAG: hypothetical protein CV087_19515 [Candidatus Brocadia sp. WS118]
MLVKNNPLAPFFMEDFLSFPFPKGDSLKSPLEKGDSWGCLVCCNTNFEIPEHEHKHEHIA